MKLVVAFVLVAGAIGWGFYGGEPEDLPQGPRMAQQLSQLNR